MLKLDHLAIVAPTLHEGVAHIREILGVEMPFGGKHPLMGTHNHLMKLGEGRFLEVIAVDPDAPETARARWFGLDDRVAIRRQWDRGHRLSAWVAATADLGAILARYGDIFGEATHQRRGDLNWLFAVKPDGSLPMEGALPSLLEWPDGIGPAHKMVDLGCRLDRLTITHPRAKEAQAVLADLGFQDQVKWSEGKTFGMTASVRTRDGLRLL